MLESLRGSSKDKRDYDKNPQKFKQSLQGSIRHHERTIKLLTERHPNTLYDMLGTFRPTQKKVDAAIKETQKQIDQVMGALAGVEQFEDETSPGYFAS